MSEILAKLRAFVSAKSPRALGDDESLIDSGAFDSLAILDLVAYIEGEFAIELADEDVSPENFRSISTIAGFLADRLRA